MEKYEYIKLNFNEYELDDEIDIWAKKEQCLIETSKVVNNCIRKVEKCVLRIYSGKEVALRCAMVFLIAIMFFVLAFIFKDTFVFLLFYFGLFAMVYIFLFAYGRMWISIKRKKFIENGKIFPAEVVFFSKREKYNDKIVSGSGDGWLTIYQYEFCLYSEQKDKIKKLKFSPDRHNFEEKELFYLYYKAKKNIFLLYNPKSRKAYPVRLFQNEEINANE